MKILFIHPNFPGQFKNLAAHFGADKNNEVIFICRIPNQLQIPGVRKIIAAPAAFKKKATTHQYLQEFESGVYRAQNMWRVLRQIKNKGFIPDVIYAHSGWGDGMFIKDLYPESKYISYMEFYYHSQGADVGFNKDIPVSEDLIAKTRVRNSINLISLVSADWLISPTKWQANLHPSDFYHKLSVIHEGIDTNKIKPGWPTENLYRELGIPESAEIITHIERNFEPYRGFEQTMQAIEILCQKRPKAHFIMIGGDEVSYSAKLPGQETYREHIMKKVMVDKSRIHWLGKVPYSKYLEVLSASHAHIYLTYPFVLSWSFLEAMAMECAIVASNTQPVLEVAKDNQHVLFVDFFDSNQIADKVIELLEDRKKAKLIGQNARKHILKHYSLDVILPKYVKIIKSIVAGKKPKAYQTN